MKSAYFLLLSFAPMMNALKDILRFSVQSSVLGALAIIVVLFGVAGFGIMLGEAAGMAGIVILLCALFVGFVALVGLIGFSFVIFRGCANGQRTVRPVTAEEFRTLWSKRFMSFAVVLLALGFGSSKLITLLPSPVGQIIALVLLILVPASMSLMLLNDSLIQAVNPVLQLRMAVELKWPYLLLPLFVGLALVAGSVIVTRGPGWPLEPIGIGFIWFLAAQLSGRVIFLYHERIGFEPVNSQIMREAEDARLEQRDTNDILDKAFASGRTDSERSLREIETLFVGENDTLEFREKILQQVQDWPNPMVGLRLEQSLITRALALGDETLAFNLVLDGLTRNTAFRPAGAGATLKMAAVAKTRGRPRIVTALLSDFWTRFADHPQRAAAALMCARVAIEKTNQPELAREQLELLGSIEKTRSNPQVLQLRAALSRVDGEHSLT